MTGGTSRGGKTRGNLKDKERSPSLVTGVGSKKEGLEEGASWEVGPEKGAPREKRPKAFKREIS